MNMDIILADKTPVRLQDIKRLNNGSLRYKKIEEAKLAKSIANQPYGNIQFMDIEGMSIDHRQFNSFIDEVAIPALMPSYFSVYDITGIDDRNAKKAKDAVQKLQQSKSVQSAEMLQDDYAAATTMVNVLRLYSDNFIQYKKQDNANFNSLISLIKGYKSIPKYKASVYATVERGMKHNIAFKVYEMPGLVTRENLLEFILTYPVNFGTFYERNFFKNLYIQYPLGDFKTILDDVLPILRNSQYKFESYQLTNQKKMFISAGLQNLINSRDQIPFDVQQLMEELQAMEEEFQVNAPYFDMLTIPPPPPEEPQPPMFDHEGNIDPVLFREHNAGFCLVTLRRWSGTGVFAHAIDMIADTVEFLRKCNKAYRKPGLELLLSKYEAGTLFTDYRRIFGLYQ